MTRHHPIPATCESFADRIKLLINRVGSATEIARRCGFSEGVVRSWRDGHTDPSRGRCVTLAQTLGISLVWLVAGEGGIQLDRQTAAPDDSQTSEQTTTHKDGARRARSGRAAAPQSTPMDTPRLLAAMKILQSELALTDGALAVTEHPEILADLYDVLGPGGTMVDTEAMTRFNRRLAERIQREREPV